MTPEIQKIYDTIIAQSMGLAVVHSNNYNEGRNVVHVEVSEPATLYMFHVAMNVGSAFGKFPIYVDSTLWDYFKLKRKYRKQAKIKRAKRKDIPFDWVTDHIEAYNHMEQHHTLGDFRNIYEVYYKGEYKW